MTLATTIMYGTKSDVEAELANGNEGINDFDEYGYTPLIEAALMDKFDIVELLLHRGAELDGKDLVGRTALHWAVDNDSYELSKFLLDQGANPNAYTENCQPILSIPFLRDNEKMKELLYQYGANLDFALDFVNAKLIGHRFELEGKIYLVDTNKKFVLLDFEGFFFEGTIGIVKHSLERFYRNYAARHLRQYIKNVREMVTALAIADELISYQIFTVQREKFERRISWLLSNDLLLFPIAYEGHAITCVKCGDLWIKVDRGYNSQIEGSVVIYKITRPQLVTKSFLKNLIYKKQSRMYVNEGINREIGLQKIGEIPLPAQIIGNCAWANVEGSVAAMLFALLMRDIQNLDRQTIKETKQAAMDFFFEWREWDKDRALEECISSFYAADEMRKAAKAMLLADVLVLKCKYTDQHDIERAEKIFPVFLHPKCAFALRSYIKVHILQQKTELGENLLHLLDLAAPKGLQVLFESDYEDQDRPV